MKKEKNEFAVELGKLSAKSRMGKMTKKQRQEHMRKLWKKSAEIRRKRKVALTLK